MKESFLKTGVLQSLDTQNVVQGPGASASPGSFLKMQNLQPQPRICILTRAAGDPYTQEHNKGREAPFGAPQVPSQQSPFCHIGVSILQAPRTVLGHLNLRLRVEWASAACPWCMTVTETSRCFPSEWQPKAAHWGSVALQSCHFWMTALFQNCQQRIVTFTYWWGWGDVGVIVA